MGLLTGSQLPCTFLLLTGLLISACQPADERPGLWLRGDVVAPATVDWGFTEGFDEVLIETSAWYLLPHSTTIWCVNYENELFIGSYGEELKFWEKNVQRNSRARLSFDGDLYQVVVSKVEDAELNRRVSQLYNSKYDMAAVFGSEIPDWWFYRVTQTP